MKLSAINIQKSYKGRKVVKGISIEVEQGEIVGLWVQTVLEKQLLFT